MNEVARGRAGFLLDLNRCVGCGACAVACRIENDLPRQVSWRRILTLNARRSPRGPTYHFSLACHHCEDPPCAAGCPSGALGKGPDGAVLLEVDLCIGCRYCEMACPFGAPSFDEERGVMTKCHFCAPRRENGLEPACTRACPTGALGFTPTGGSGEEAFAAPRGIPGFTDPGEAGPNLRMAAPRGGLRSPLFESLAERIGKEGETPHG